MISFLEGTILEKKKNTVVLLTSGGVGYDIFMSSIFVETYTLGKKVQIPVYLKVSDSALQLFGFNNAEQRAFFELLLGVSGVGPKSAMNILAIGSIDEIQSAIARSDVAYLTAVQGMGKKTAERVVVELKNKIKRPNSTNQIAQGDVLADVIDGLVAMGYGKEEAREHVQQIHTKDKTVEQILREVLQTIR